MLISYPAMPKTKSSDGDGRQVKSTINGVTTTFVGAHYQIVNGTVTKYYFAGASRIAMKTGNTLTYLLGDHLGSTSLTTDAAGVKVSEMRYKPWGETRYSSGTTATNYRYTGQREEAGFGLYFYNARWYDSALGRFAQADSIVPGGVQGLDRYAYVGNSPVRYTDPSGHCRIDDNIDECFNPSRLVEIQKLVQQAIGNPDKPIYGKYTLEAIANLYGIEISPDDHWEYEPFMVRIYGQPGPLGNTPHTSNEEFYGYNTPTLDVKKTTDDFAVYITGTGFEYCKMNIACIVSIMTHEAVHSWIEYLIGGDNPSETPELAANEELFASSVGMQVFPIGTEHFQIHAASIQQSCDVASYNCSTPQNTLESVFNIDLSAIANLILR